MKPVISIIMGSKSDWATMQKAAEVLDNFGVAYEKSRRKIGKLTTTLHLGSFIFFPRDLVPCSVRKTN